MDPKIKERLLQMGQQEKRFEGLYRSLASGFRFPDCSMWIMYYLAMEDAPLTQHELMDRMMYSKQTIHSAVSWLIRQGWVRLEASPESRRSKDLLLTDAGKEAAQATVQRLLAAEARAVARMGDEKMAQFIALHEELSRQLRQAFAQEGLPDGQAEHA